MAKAAVIVSVRGDVNLGDIDKARATLNRLEADIKGTQTSTAQASGAFGGLGNSLKALGGIMAATFTVTAVTDFLRDSMQAAMEDQKSMVALATAMDNVGLASKNAASEELIRSMSMQFGVADDKLRPAYQRLITATKDVGQAQSLLKTALDISAAGYADTESAAKALSAAAMGNFTALQRLKLPIDANAIAAKDFDAAMVSLNSVVGGQAAAAAETYQGKLNRMTVAVGEAKETIGYAFLNAIDDVSNAFGGADGATSMIAKFGDEIADLISNATRAIPVLSKLGDSLFGAGSGSRIMGAGFDAALASVKNFVGGPFSVAVDTYDALTKKEEDNSAQVSVLTARYAGLAAAIDAANTVAAGRAGRGFGTYQSAQDGRDWGAFYQGNQSAQAAAAGARTSIDSILAKAAEAAKKLATGGGGGSSGGSSGPSAAEKKAQDAANKAIDAMKQRFDQLKSYAEQAGRAVTGFLSIDAAFTAFSDRQKAASDAYAALIEAQKQIGEEATQSEKDRVAELQKVYDSAKEAAGKGASDIVGEFVARAEKAKQFGEKLKILLANNLNKQTFDEIAGMSADRGTEIADAFINGNISENISRVNDAVNSAKVVADSVGVQAATTFKDVGEGLALGMMQALASILDPNSKQAKALNAMMDGFAGSLRRVTTVDIVTRRYEAGQPPPEVPVGVSQPVSNASGSGGAAQVSSFNQMTQTPTGNWFGGIRLFADGGLVTSPTLGMVGEAGPEAVIPLSRAGSMLGGGNTYQITVQAGIGDPRAIGQQVVEAITRFERANGPVYAKA